MAKRWLQFDRDWSFSPKERHGQTMIDYRAGKFYAAPPMRVAAYDAALAAGAAREVSGPADSGEAEKVSSGLPGAAATRRKAAGEAKADA